MLKVRGWAVLGLAIVLVSAISVQPTNAVAKNGKPCTKRGATSTNAGVRYTCIKLAGKLVWKRSAPAATVTPTPTPTSTFKPPTAPTSFDDLIANYAGIAYAAWSKSSLQIAKGQVTPTQIRFVVGPHSTLTYKDPSSAFGLVSRLYSGFANPKETVILAFNFQDRDWATRQIDELVPSAQAGPWIQGVACKTESTCWGGGVFTDGSPTIVIVLATEIHDKNHIEGTVDAHEYTHAMMLAEMKALNPWPMRDPWPPTWFWEGQAQFSQNAAIFHNSFSKYLERRREASDDLFRFDYYNSAFFNEYFEVNPPDSWRSKYEGWRQYDLGAMFVEILVALKGPAAVMQMWQKAYAGLGFKAAFEEVFGTPFDEALPIMAKAIALEVGHS